MSPIFSSISNNNRIFKCKTVEDLVGVVSTFRNVLVDLNFSTRSLLNHRDHFSTAANNLAWKREIIESVIIGI